MSLPIAFVLGLLVLASASDWWLVLPGSGNPLWAWAAALLLALPALLTRMAGRRSRRLLPPLAAGLLPVTYGVLLGPGGWLDLADRWSGASHALGAALAMAPLVVGELLRIRAECSDRGWPAGQSAQRRQRVGLMLLFAVPWLLLAAGNDLLQPHPRWHALLTGTSVGLSLATFGFVLLLGVLMPLAFHRLLGLRAVPEPLGEQLRRAAEALGFPGHRVLLLDSGMRTVNALLLGPLPWPRYLVLSDGLLATLGHDHNAIRGVVAHEVGHAQAGHPALLILLFLVVPLLAAAGMPWLSWEDVGSGWLLLAAVVSALFAWRLVRAVGHRFEHEADVLSAIALGGAEPCIRALQHVGRILQQDASRASLLHPSERARTQLLRRFAEDPAFRARFALRGRRLRRVVFGLLTVGLLGAAAAWHALWPMEQAVCSYRSGAFAVARAQAEVVGTAVPSGSLAGWLAFRTELDAASAIAPEGGDPRSIEPILVREGWRRGVEVLVRDGPAAARPWLVLANEGRVADPVRRSVLLFCEAAHDNDLERMERIAAHVRRLGVPSELVGVFGRSWSHETERLPGAAGR